MNVVRLTPRDLYRLRRARLVAQRAALRAQYAQQQLEELALEMERSYGLLATDGVLDVQTGRIQVRETGLDDHQPSSHTNPNTEEEVARGPAHHAY